MTTGTRRSRKQPTVKSKQRKSTQTFYPVDTAESLKQFASLSSPTEIAKRMASIIKNREKKKKKTLDKPSFFESPLWKRVEEHAKDWDNRGTAQRALKSMEKAKKVKGVKPAAKAKPVDPSPATRIAPQQKEVEPMDKAIAAEGRMEGMSKPAELKPHKPAKRSEQNPNYQTELKKEDQRNRKIKKARKKKAEKPTSEFMEKYYGKDWA